MLCCSDAFCCSLLPLGHALGFWDGPAVWVFGRPHTAGLGGAVEQGALLKELFLALEPQTAFGCLGKISKVWRFLKADLGWRSPSLLPRAPGAVTLRSVTQCQQSTPRVQSGEGCGIRKPTQPCSAVGLQQQNPISLHSAALVPSGAARGTAPCIQQCREPPPILTAPLHPMGSMLGTDPTPVPVGVCPAPRAQHLSRPQSVPNCEPAANSACTLFSCLLLFFNTCLIFFPPFFFLIFFLFFIFLHKSATLSPEPACSEGMVCTTAIISKNRWSEEQKVC